MIDHVERRFLSLFLAILMVITMMPVNALAASLFTTTVLDGKVSISGDGTSGLGSGTNTNDVVDITASAEKDTCSGSYTAKAHTITIANATADETLLLSFAYEASNFGGFSVAGVDKASAPKGTWNGELAVGESMTIVLTSKADATVASLVLSGFSLQSNGDVTVTVEKHQNAEIKVADEVLSGENKTVTTNFLNGVQLSVTANTGFVFLGWEDENGKVISTSPATTINPKSAMTIKARVVEKNTKAYWMANDKIYDDLSQATDAAASGNGVVVLLKDATLPAGTYSIPQNITLLIPFDAANSVYYDVPEYESKFATPSAFRTLTMAEGAKLNVAGALSVAAKHATIRGGKPDGSAPTGKYGHILMNKGSEINVTGSLYAWGYISGDGVVTAENGAVVYENMQFTDFRGGTVTSGMLSGKIFPMFQYYIQNIETKLVLKPGATEYARATVEASGTIEGSAVKFISPDSDSMFNTLSNTIITKEYHPETDRLEINVEGGFNMNSMSLSVNAPILGQITINSKNYILPINSNIDINVNSGVAKINQDIALLPGVSVTVAEEATLQIESNIKVAVYDRDDYVGKGFLHGGKDLICAPYSPSSGRKVRTSDDLVDAVLDLNGTIIANGELYTTTGGAQIISSEKSGVVVFGTSAGTAAYTYMANTEGKTVNVPVTAAKLLNGDKKTYVSTDGATQLSGFIYNAPEDQWDQMTDFVIEFHANNGTETQESQTVTVAEMLMGSAQGSTRINLQKNTFEYESAEFVGWAKTANGAVVYSDQASIPYAFNTKMDLYAVWEANLYLDGEVIGKPVVGNKLSEILGNTIDCFAFYKDPDCTQLTEITEDKMPAYDLYAKTLYTLTFLNENGDPIENSGGEFIAGADISAPEYNAPEGYTIVGWRNTAKGEIEDIPATMPENDLEYQVVLEEITYTLTFVDPDGNVLFTGEYAPGAKISAYKNYEPAAGHEVQWRNNATGNIEDVPTVMPKNDLEYQVVETPITYTVTWIVGEETIETEVKFGEAIVKPEDPTKDAEGCTAYRFTGWGTIPETMPAEENLVFTATFESYTSHTSSEFKYVDNKNGTHDKLYACCNAVAADNEEHTYTNGKCACEVVQTFTVTWIVDGKTKYTETVAYGSNASVKEVPDKTGYTGVWDNDGKNITGTTTITAVYTAIEYTLTFNLTSVAEETGKTVSGVFKDKPNPYTVTDVYGTEISLPDITAPEGYYLAGWTVDGASVQLPTTMPAVSRTYVAVWELIDASVKFIDGEDKTVKGEKYFDKVIAPKLTKEGYTFLGWDDNTDANDTEVMYAGGAEITLTDAVPAELYAKWEATPYTISYDLDGGALAEGKENPVSYTIESADITLINPTKEGYTFAGWTGTDLEKATEKVTIVKGSTGARSYTATWTINEYTITWIVGDVTSETTVKHGETPSYDGTPTKTEDAQYTYEFSGWTPEVVKATGNATYTAQFTGVLRSYDITFVVDGQEDKVVSTNYGETPVYDVDNDEEADTPTKTEDVQYSYTFAGWKDSADNVYATAELPKVSGDATYTATWTETKREYTITFMVDGETWHVEEGSYNDTVDYTDLVLPSMTGYSFAWDKALPDTFTENVTITGSWTVNQYTITFKGDFNTGKDDAFADYTITKNYGEDITAEDINALKAALPTITGWEFLGWYYAEERVYEEADAPVWVHTDEYEIPATMGAEDVTVYAKWDKISYLLSVYSSIESEVDCITSTTIVYEEYLTSLEEFNSFNGFCYDANCEEEGCTCLLPEGYTFAGYKYPNGSDVDFPYTQPDCDIDIVAQFVPIEYTITFTYENGDVIDRISYHVGDDITEEVEAITVSKDGYQFSCWMKDGKCVENFSNMPAADMEVVASFNQLYYINVYVNDGDTEPHASFGYIEGAEVEPDLLDTVMVPEKTGHTFLSWSGEVPATMGAENVSIYAIWDCNSYSLTVDGTPSDIKYGTEVSITDPEAREGWKFIGWKYYLYEAGEKVEIDPVTKMPAYDVYAESQWTINQYTITFDVDGIAPITADYGSDIVWPADPVKVGHTFQGWSTDGKTVIEQLPEKMPADGLNLKAVWQKNTVYINFVVGDNEIMISTPYGETPVYDVNDDDVADTPIKATDAKYSYVFAGWATENGDVLATLPGATAEATYYAVFAQDEAVKYTVKFVDGENPVYETKIAWNATVDLNALDGFTAPIKEGNSLTWTVDGSEATFPYGMTTKEVTFVAQWTPNTYTITADGVEYSFTYGTGVSIPNPADREGHTFNGWLKDGIAYNLPKTMPAENIVITSDWTVLSYTLTVWSSDETGADISKTESVPYGANLFEYYLPTPSFTIGGMFYEFVEWDAWKVDGETKTEYEGTTMPASDVELQATYTITGWDTDEDGNTTYYVKSEMVYFNQWATIDGAAYYFDGASYIAKDITEIEGSYYAFNHENGEFLSELTGIYTASNGDLYYVENGIAVQNKGLVQITEDDHIHYYYFGCGVAGCTVENCAGEYKAQKDNRHWVENTNGYLMKGGYTFGDDGVIEHIDDTSVTGIYTIAGVKYYLMDGVKVPMGLFKIGNDYYYAKSSGQLAVSESYWISKSKLNGYDLTAGSYMFDADGKIVFSQKNGFVWENDAWYYYVDGVLNYAGLMEGKSPVDGAEGMLYVNSKGMLIIGCDYWISKNNGLVAKNKTFTFAENGIMSVPEVKNGFYYEDGAWYYYVDNSKNYAGLIWSDGPDGNDPGYYYVNTKGMLIVDRNYWISKNNGHMPNMSYNFAANGKMTNPYVAEELPDGQIKDGIVAENGSLYYYVDGVLTYAGLIQLDGNYYYVKTNGEVVNNCKYWISKNNGLMKNRSYTFDENGVMLDPSPIVQ